MSLAIGDRVRVKGPKQIKGQTGTVKAIWPVDYPFSHEVVLDETGLVWPLKQDESKLLRPSFVKRLLGRHRP